VSASPAPSPGIGRDDLRAAVAAGIVTEAQAARLVALHDGRRGARENLREGDEPFELFRGFNEVFIVTGLAILAVGWMGASALYVSAWAEGPVFGDSLGGVVARTVQAALLGALILWGLSEYFVRRRRMVAPAIALAVLWAGNAAIGLAAAFAQPFMVAQADFGSLALPFGLATLAVGLHWLRFRVPFSLALVAVGLFATALVAATRAGTPESVADLFLLSAGGPFARITLLLGLATFAAAMAFDLSDPHRVTRRAANGFWLHLVAAPMLVNTVALTLLEQGTAPAQGLLLLFVALVALVAVVIDRRSFLVAGAGYVVTLGSTVFGGTGGALTVLALGAALLLLGALWERARAALLRPLAPLLPLHRLPPAS
jgi:hypothetical protein